MIRKHLQLTFEFAVSVEDITSDSVARDLSHYTNKSDLVDAPETYELAERQKKLLNALISNEDLLKKYIYLRVFSNFEGGEFYNDIFKFTKISNISDENLLKPVMDSLSNDEAEFFNMVAQEGLFSENTEHFFESFKVDLINVELTDLA